MKKYCVYMHTCPNGKVYIGITSQTPSKRWSRGSGYVKNDHFYKAILKYGWDNINHEILFDSLSETEACEKEVELIAMYDSTNPAYGYNNSLGGEHSSPTKSTREKISIAHTGMRHTEETLEKLRHAKKNVSYETRQRQRVAKLGKKLSNYHREKISKGNKKPVKCIELGKIYDSAQDAGKELGIWYTAIADTARGNTRHKTAGGYHWKYVK